MNANIANRLKKYQESDKVNEECQTSGACEGLVPEHVRGQMGILPSECTDIPTTNNPDADVKKAKKINEVKGTPEPTDKGKDLPGHSNVQGKAEKPVVGNYNTQVPSREAFDVAHDANEERQRQRRERWAATDEAFETKSEEDFLAWCNENL